MKALVVAATVVALLAAPAGASAAAGISLSLTPSVPGEAKPFQIAATGAHLDGPTAPYLSTVVEELRTTVIRKALRSEVPVVCEEQLVVEFYAR